MVGRTQDLLTQGNLPEGQNTYIYHLVGKRLTLTKSAVRQPTKNAHNGDALKKNPDRQWTVSDSVVCRRSGCRCH